MLVTNVKVPAGGSIVVTLPFDSVGIRRIIMSIRSNDSNVTILIDTVPGSPINENYFEVHTI